MDGVSAIGLFCEDIREEKSGQDTIIGILPNNMRVSALPGTLPKLCLYVRINMDPASAVDNLSLRLLLPDGSEVYSNDIDRELLAGAREEALKEGAPLVGIISKAIFGQFQIREAGRLLVMAKSGDTEAVCAFLNVQTEP